MQKSEFEGSDSLVRHAYRELGFYNSIKETFGCETYLNIGLSYQEQKRLAQFRISLHIVWLIIDDRKVNE